MVKKLLTATAVAGTAYAGLGFLLFYEVMGRNARIPKYATAIFDKKHSDPKPSTEHNPVDDYVEWFRKNDREKFELTNAEGNKICAFLMPADEPSDKYIVCAHGYRSSGQGDFRFIGKFFHDQGYNVFFVDHQALGQSEGDFITFGHREARDLFQWLDFMVDRFGKDIQIALYGISMGSGTVMYMSDNEKLPENVKCIIADCGFTDLNELFSFVLQTVSVPSKPLIFMANQFNKLFAKWDFNNIRPIESVKNAKVPMLFIHGEKDDFVPTYMAGKLYNACTSEKDYLIVPNAGHAESYQKGHELYEEKVKEFFGKYFK